MCMPPSWGWTVSISVTMWGANIQLPRSGPIPMHLLLIEDDTTPLNRLS